MHAIGQRIRIETRDGGTSLAGARVPTRIVDAIHGVLRRFGIELCFRAGPLVIPVLGRSRGLGRVTVPLGRVLLRYGAFS